MTTESEWDPDKEAANIQKHGISFTQAAAAFRAAGYESFLPAGLIDMSKKSIFAKMRRNGTLVRVKDDGSEEPMPVTPLAPRTEQEIEAAALADPDAQPLRDADLKRMRRVPQVKTLRRALGLTQEEFAARYQIPLGTLRDWEQGRAEPDQPARAYLKVIARDPERVHRMLQASPY